MESNGKNHSAPSPVAKSMRESAHRSLSHVRPMSIWKKAMLFFRGRRDAKHGILVPMPDGSYETPALRSLQAQAMEDVSLNWIEASDYVSVHVEPRLRHLESVYKAEKSTAETILADQASAGEEAMKQYFPGDEGEDPALVHHRKQERAARARAAVAQRAAPHLARAHEARKEALESGLLAQYEDRVKTSEGKQGILVERYHESACAYLEAGRVRYELGICDIPAARLEEPRKLFHEHFPPYQFDLDNEMEAYDGN